MSSGILSLLKINQNALKHEIKQKIKKGYTWKLFRIPLPPRITENGYNPHKKEEPQPLMEFFDTFPNLDQRGGGRWS